MKLGLLLGTGKKLRCCMLILSVTLRRRSWTFYIIDLYHLNACVDLADYEPVFNNSPSIYDTWTVVKYCFKVIFSASTVQP